MMDVTKPKVHMGQITGGEAREIYSSNPVILLPMGSQEDQGPHGPMGDYLLAEKVTELIAIKATGDGTRTLVAPVLPFGGLDFFGSMIGGMTLQTQTLAAVISDMINSLHRHGLTRIVVINGHGGNVGPIDDVTRAIYRESRMVVPSLYLWRIAYSLLPDLIGTDVAARVSGHGADPLTSIGMPHEYDEILNSGVDKGDPRLSSAETGRLLTDKLVDVAARFITHFATRLGTQQA